MGTGTNTSWIPSPLNCVPSSSTPIPSIHPTVHPSIHHKPILEHYIMRPTLSLLLLSALCLAPSALAIPQQNGQPGQSNGQISVTVSANGQTRQVKLPLVPGLRGAPECDNDDGLDPTDNDPEDVFCRNLRAELGKIPELASLARGGAITITAFASSETSTGGGNGGNGGQNGGGGGGGGSTPAPAFKENAQNVVVYRPPNNAAPVTITVPAVPACGRFRGATMTTVPSHRQRSRRQLLPPSAQGDCSQGSFAGRHCERRRIYRRDGGFWRSRWQWRRGRQRIRWERRRGRIQRSERCQRRAASECRGGCVVGARSTGWEQCDRQGHWCWIGSCCWCSCLV
ncbi:hypothetical protein BCR44DRAFT_1429340, partial [Catenaria anguillulae PL171]